MNTFAGVISGILILKRNHKLDYSNVEFPVKSMISIKLKNRIVSE